jgi:LysM repeat protein
VIAPLIGLAALVAGACGTTDQASRDTLPPIRTTTSTTTTSTTIPNDRFYTIERGDTLAVIAARFQVTVESIVELNGLSNPDDIQAGQTIEIPANVRQRAPASRARRKKAATATATTEG